MAIVKLFIDPKHPPSLSVEQRERLAALALMPDTAIDYSDDAASASSEMKWARPGLPPAAPEASG